MKRELKSNRLEIDVFPNDRDEEETRLKMKNYTIMLK